MSLSVKNRVTIFICCIALFLAILVHVLISGELGFFSPQKGTIVPGEKLVVKDRTNRQRVTLTVSERMVDDQGTTDLESLTERFALVKDTLPCSIISTDLVTLSGKKGRAFNRGKSRKREVGDPVTLCLQP